MYSSIHTLINLQHTYYVCTVASRYALHFTIPIVIILIIITISIYIDTIIKNTRSIMYLYIIAI